MMNIATTSVDDGNGEEDSEDSSSFSANGVTSTITNQPNQFRSMLDEFREKWQQELKTTSTTLDNHTLTTNNKINDCNHENNSKVTSENDEERAKEYFMKGIEFEKCGKVYDALHFYRRATQIVPDIEFRIYEVAKTQQNNPEKNNNNIVVTDNIERRNSKDNLYPEDDCNNQEDEDLSNVDLRLRFQNAITRNGGKLIEKAKSDADLIKTGGKAHISDLPMEIILYILRWVASSHLDLRSLEQCASVCKGLYLCARDEEIWKSACLKVWGVNTGLLRNTPYLSWRQMFIERHRINFNGCYISKTTYIRYGENSFQDQFYQPIQLIEYYRYIRFLPDGTVLMLTTADEPQQSVSKLKNLNQLRSDVLCGRYRLHGDLIILVLTRSQKPQTFNRKKLTSSENTENCGSNNGNGNVHTFYIELQVSNSSKRRFCQLNWKHYSIIQMKNKSEVSTEFELTKARYPPLWFSRVKSYHLESEIPLK